MKFEVRVFPAVPGEDFWLHIINNDNGEKIRVCVGRDGYQYAATPVGGGYATENIAKFIAQTLNQWTS